MIPNMTPIRVKRQLLSKEVCLFCGQSGDLHEVMTLEVDEKVRQRATDIQNSASLKQLAREDMIAAEAKYHRNMFDQSNESPESISSPKPSLPANRTR